MPCLERSKVSNAIRYVERDRIGFAGWVLPRMVIEKVNESPVGATARGTPSNFSKSNPAISLSVEAVFYLQGSRTRVRIPASVSETEGLGRTRGRIPPSEAGPCPPEAVQDKRSWKNRQETKKRQMTGGQLPPIESGSYPLWVLRDEDVSEPIPDERASVLEEAR